jgi:8-oxo-dGTP diphosphatase
LVHRPRYDDWSLPKGKLDEGEDFEQAALREVEEETGVRGTIEGELGSSFYEPGGVPKEVRWFRMTGDGDAEARMEVDAVRWVTPEEARALLSYDGERALLNRLR